MEKALRIFDATLILTLISGLLYFLGYQYLLYYYSYFGLNIHVRDPSVQLVLCRGFYFAEYLIGALIVAAAVFVFARQALQRIADVFNWQVPRLIPMVSMACALLVFIGVFQPIGASIQNTAYESGRAAIQARRSAPPDIVLLKDGSTLPGDLRLHFFGPTLAVFMDFSPRPTSPNPRMVIVQLSEIKAITTN
jgi:hypothetical protein